MIRKRKQKANVSVAIEKELWGRAPPHSGLGRFSSLFDNALAVVDHHARSLVGSSIAEETPGHGSWTLTTPLSSDAILNRPEKTSRGLLEVRARSVAVSADKPRIFIKSAMPRFQIDSWGDRILAGDISADSLLSAPSNELQLRRWDPTSLLLAEKKYYNLADIAVQLLVGYVSQQRYQDLYDMLLALPLEKSKPETTDRLLRILLRRAMLNDDIISAAILEDVWENTIEFSEVRHLPLWILIAAKPRFTILDLRFIYRLHEDEGYLFAMMTVSDRLDGRSARRACEQLYKLFEPDLNTLRSAYLYSSNMNNFVEEFISAKLEYDRIENAAYPDWVISPLSEGSWKCPEDPDVAFEAVFEKKYMPELMQDGKVDRERIADIVLAPSDKYSAPDGVYSLPLDERRQLLLKEIESWSYNDIKKLLRPYFLLRDRELLSKDEELFRAYGPAHPLLSNDPNDFLLGGERMLLRSIRDDSDDLALDEGKVAAVAWFTGICDSCKRRIQSRWHALRMPVRLGGWKGVFCSFECLRDQAQMYVPDCEDPLISAKGKTPEELMVDEIEKDIRKWGIQDRILSHSDPETINEALLLT